MSWLSDLGNKIGLRFDSRTLGNLVKNVSPAAALIPGAGPLAAAGLAAGGSAAGDLLRGHSIDAGSILTNAGLGYGLGKSGFLKSAANPGSASVTPSASSVPAVQPTIQPGGIAPPMGAPAPAALPPAPSPGLIRGAVNSVGSGLSKTGSFIEHNPNAAGMGLQGLGNLATAGAQNRIASANANLLQQKYEMTDEDRKRRQELEAYLSAHPIEFARRAPPNPYTTAGTA